MQLIINSILNELLLLQNNSRNASEYTLSRIKWNSKKKSAFMKNWSIVYCLPPPIRLDNIYQLGSGWKKPQETGEWAT